MLFRDGVTAARSIKMTSGEKASNRKKIEM